MDAKYWKDVKKVALSDTHSVCLHSDGTVSAVGNGDNEGCQVDDWKDIVDIQAGSHLTLGLTKSGNVVTVGIDGHDSKEKLESLSNIVDISIFSGGFMALTAEGDVICVAWENTSPYKVTIPEKEVVDIESSSHAAFALCSDGTVAVMYNRDRTSEENLAEMAEWTDIVSIACGSHHVVGLRKDGTVVAVSTEEDRGPEYKGFVRECAVGNWTDIVAIAAGCYDTVGVKADGSLVKTGMAVSNHHMALNEEDRQELENIKIKFQD